MTPADKLRVKVAVLVTAFGIGILTAGWGVPGW